MEIAVSCSILILALYHLLLVSKRKYQLNSSSNACLESLDMPSLMVNPCLSGDSGDGKTHPQNGRPVRISRCRQCKWQSFVETRPL